MSSTCAAMAPELPLSTVDGLKSGGAVIGLWGAAPPEIDEGAQSATESPPSPLSRHAGADPALVPFHQAQVEQSARAALGAFARVRAAIASQAARVRARGALALRARRPVAAPRISLRDLACHAETLREYAPVRGEGLGVGLGVRRWASPSESSCAAGGRALLVPSFTVARQLLLKPRHAAVTGSGEGRAGSAAELILRGGCGGRARG